MRFANSLRALAFATVLALAWSHGASAITGNSLVIQVFSDGSALVTQSMTVASSAGSVQVPLLSPVLSNVVATDQSGSPLSWKISGGNITIYTLGATAVTLTYETQNLTNKTGTVWTLGFVTYYNTTVVLPKSSSISSISGTPYSLQVEGGSPVAYVAQGRWAISYGVPLGATQTSTTTGIGTTGATTGTIGTSTGTGGTGGGPLGGFLGVSGPQLDEVLVVALILAAAAVGALWWRRRLSLGPQGAELRPDDVKVLGFIQEQGGKVLEPEIRMKFALPKTSAWRQIKRLERLGYLKVTKIGSQNQIELVKKRDTT